MGWRWMGGPDMSDTATHEASHAAAAITLGREVEWVWRTDGLAFAGETVGQCRAPVAERVEASQIVICVIGYLSEGEDGWPPPWPEALEEPREALGRVLTLLGATEEIYTECVGIARAMLADPQVLRLRNALARALYRVPRLEREDIQAIAAIYKPE